MGLVRITSRRYPNFNGSHFGLPPIKIHRMTGLPPKIVWTITYSHRPKFWQYIDKAPFSSKSLEKKFSMCEENLRLISKMRKKTAIATHKMVEETSPKQHLCCQFEGISSTMTKFCTLSRIREVPFSLKSFAEGSQSVRKSAFWSRRWRNHAARSKLSGVVFAITFSGAFQFTLTTTTATTVIVSCSAAIFPQCKPLRKTACPHELPVPQSRFLWSGTRDPCYQGVCRVITY